MAQKVLLTGASGFIGKHILLALLKRDYQVIGTVRSAQKADKVKKLMERLGADTTRLSFEQLDLTKDEGWEDIAKGCDYVQHIASPFPFAPAKDRESLVPVARDGALRVLKAAIKADAKHFVFTASIVSMMHNKERSDASVLGEKDWTDPEWDILTAYTVSKTRAEQAIWKHAEKAGYSNAVTSIHPGLVLGPSLDETIGTSLEVIKGFLKGKYPLIPKVSLPVVDVRDVAELHILAMLKENTGERRLLAADKTLSFMEIATILKKQYPTNWKLPKVTLPDLMIKHSTWFDPALKALIPDLGRENKTDTDYVTDLTGHQFRPSSQAVCDAADSLYSNHIL